jgi:predicted RND superfamily exporter protein
MLTKSNLMEFMKLYEQIGELTATVNGDVQTLNSLCIRDNSNGDPCLIISVLENWQYSSAVLSAEADDESVLDTLNARNSEDDLLDTLGNMNIDSTGRIISASAAKIVYILQDNKEVVEGDYVDERGNAWEQEFLDFLLEPKSTANFPNLKVFPVAQRSFSDEFGEAIQGDISLLIFSYIILLVYVGVNLGHMDSSCIQMRVVLALSVLVTVGMAIVSSTGLASSMGIMYTPLHSLLPFILLGIGVDDSFVIADAFDTVNAAASPRDKIAVALSHAGVSITITSLTDLVAFAVSSVTSLPALSSFCVYAALGVTFLYLFQISFFSAVLTIDGMRQSSRRRDVCCCLVVPETDKGEDNGKSPADGDKDIDKNGVEMSSRRHVAPLSIPPSYPTVAPTTHQAVATSDHETNAESQPLPTQHAGALHAFLEHVYAVFLMTPMVKASVLVVFLGFVTYSIIGATRLSVESSERSFIPDDSYVLDALDRNDKYFGERGITVDIVTYDFDHFERQDILANMQSKFDGYEKKSPYIEGMFTTTTTTNFSPLIYQESQTHLFLISYSSLKFLFICVCVQILMVHHLSRGTMTTCYG